MEKTTAEEKQGLPLRIFRSATATEYEKRVIAHSDIMFSLKCVIRLRDLNKNDDSDQLFRKALWDAAVIRLLSIFDGPKGLKKKDILDNLPEGAREAVQFFDNYRNKHIAHKVNPIEQVKAGIILSDENSSKRKVLAVGHLLSKDASFADPSFVGSLGKFAEVLRVQIEKEIKTLEELVLQEAKERPIQNFYRLPPLRIVFGESGHLRKGMT